MTTVCICEGLLGSKRIRCVTRKNTNAQKISKPVCFCERFPRGVVMGAVQKFPPSIMCKTVELLIADPPYRPQNVPSLKTRTLILNLFMRYGDEVACCTSCYPNSHRLTDRCTGKIIFTL